MKGYADAVDDQGLAIYPSRMGPEQPLPSRPKLSRLAIQDAAAVHHGKELGRLYANVGDAPDAILAKTQALSRAFANSTVGRVEFQRRMIGTHAVVTFIYLLGAGFFIAFCVEANRGFSESGVGDTKATRAALALLGYWFFVSAIWLVGVLVAYWSHESTKEEVTVRRLSLEKLTHRTAIETIIARRALAQSQEAAEAP